MAYSRVEKVEGEAGAFRVTVRRKARYVDEEKCTGCGACAEKCPTPVPDAFNVGIGERRAIYSYFAQGIPSTHTIDPAHCRQLQGKKCGVCARTCQAGAIDFDQTDRIVTCHVAAIIVAAGFEVFDPSQIAEYGYGRIHNVVTAIEFERLLSASGPTHGHVERPSDRAFRAEIERLEKQAAKSIKALERLEKKFGEPSEEAYGKFMAGATGDDPEKKRWADTFESHRSLSGRLEEMRKEAESFTVAKRLAFVQCVGSRDFRFYPYCSGYCCMHSIKEAMIAHEHAPETRATLFGMDIRAVGKGFEEYKIRGGNTAGIAYIRGRVAEITEGPGHCPVVTYEDTRKQRIESREFDMVILATACAPAAGMAELAGVLGIERDSHGFVRTDPVSPVDTSVPGIFVCGCAVSPMDVPESVAQASSAAERAAEWAGRAKEDAVA